MTTSSPTPNPNLPHTQDPSWDASSNPASHFPPDPEASLSQLERDVLAEYELLLENLNKLSPLLSNLSINPTAALLDELRLLERKTSLVSTLLKASVYSIVLQQEMLEGEGEGE